MKKYRLNIIILISMSIFIMYLVLKDDFGATINYLGNVNIFWILVSILFMFINILFQSLSVYCFLKEVKPDYKFLDTFMLMLSALFFNAITPFSSGGQPFQMYLLKKQGVKLTDSGNVLLQNFFTFQFALTLMGTFSIVINYFFDILPKDSILKRVVLIGYIINILVLLLLLFLSRAKKANTHFFNKIFDFIFGFRFIKNRDILRKRASEKIDDFYNSALYFKNNKKNLIKSLLYNLLSLIFLYLVPVFIFYSIGEFNSINAFESIVALGYTYLIGSFIPAPGGTGGLEYAFVQFFQGFIVGASLSAIMILWRFVTYYLGMIVGSLSLLHFKKEVK